MANTPHHVPALGRLYLWATHRLYDEFAWTYDLAAWIVSAGRWDGWRRLALDYVAMQPVLEVGFGTGELLIEMARRGWRVAGIDLSTAMHRQTAAKMHRRGVAAPRHQGRVQALPYADRTFGAVVATFPAEYIVDSASLAEIQRVLRPGGRLVIAGMVVYRRDAWWGRLSRLIFGDGPSAPVERFEQRLANAGLRAELILRDDPPWQVPIIVAEKP